MIAVGGEEGQWGTGRWSHPPDDEPHRCGVRLTLEGGIEPVSEVFGRTNVVIKTASIGGYKTIIPEAQEHLLAASGR